MRRGWRGPSLCQPVQEAPPGTYGTHGYDLSLKNGGISLLHSKYIPASTWTQIQAAQAQIKAGKISIPVAHNAGAVQKLIK